MRNPVLAWQGVLKHGLSQAYKFRNNETNKELRPITPQCKCGLKSISEFTGVGAGNFCGCIGYFAQKVP